MILVLFYETSEGVQQSQKCLLFNEGSHAKFLECPYYMLSKLSLQLGDESQALEGSDQSQARSEALFTRHGRSSPPKVSYLISLFSNVGQWEGLGGY